MNWLEKLIVFVLAVIAFLLLAAISVGAQYVCVNHYAPWLLSTNDKQAIAFYCKPQPGK
jgi:hypothetical protein